MSDETTYFANLKGTELSRAVGKRVDTFHDFCKNSGLYALWLKSYQQYYGMGRDGFTSHEVRRHGASNEFLKVSINHFRSLISHLITLSTGTRKALEPVATSDTYESEQEVRKAKGVLEFWMREALETAIQRAEEYAVVLGRGFVCQTWNAMKGEEVTLGEEGAPPLRTGMLEAHHFMPVNVAHDPEWDSENVPWVCTRRWVNRHDLIADLAGADEQLAEAIRGVRPSRRDRELEIRELIFTMGHSNERAEDQVALYEFWHERTPACPRGRHAQFLSDEVLLFSEDLPYQGVTVRGLSPAIIMGTPWGYTTAWDLLAPQEMVDTLRSIELTNQATHGLGLIAIPKGSGAGVTEIAKGLTMFEYNPGTGKPEAINFTGTPMEIISNQQRTVQEMETVSGINSVVRGQPEASLKSGAALALIQAQAIQSSAMFQSNDVAFTEHLGDDCLTIFRRYATEPLKMDVEGADGYLISNEVGGHELEHVRRVRVDVGNPLMRTIAGRVQLAESMVQQQLVKDPQQFLRVIETGRLEPLTEHESRERANIKAENEMLSRARFKADPLTGQPMMQPQVDPSTGQPTGKMEGVLDESTLPVALKTDNPFLHAQQHATVLADPRARRNPAVVRATLAHIQAHKEQHAFCSLMDPGTLELMGIPPQAAAMATAGQAVGAPPGAPQQGALPAGKPAQGQSGTARVLDASPEDPRTPSLPKLPPGSANATGINPTAPGPGGTAQA